MMHTYNRKGEPIELLKEGHFTNYVRPVVDYFRPTVDYVRPVVVDRTAFFKLLEKGENYGESTKHNTIFIIF